MRGQLQLKQLQLKTLAGRAPQKRHVETKSQAVGLDTKSTRPQSIETIEQIANSRAPEIRGTDSGAALCGLFRELRDPIHPVLASALCLPI
jgi:hypothetical protein